MPNSLDGPCAVLGETIITISLNEASSAACSEQLAHSRTAEAILKPDCCLVSNFQADRVNKGHPWWIETWERISKAAVLVFWCCLPISGHRLSSVVCWDADAWWGQRGKAGKRRIHAGSSDSIYVTNWLSLVCGIARDSFRKQCPERLRRTL